jgi:RHS repeat-associated protein
LGASDNGRGSLGCFQANPDNSVIAQKFTSKERDAETGLDYFEARYYSGAQGRFTSPDPSRESVDTTNPQSWNRYAYTYNNPLRYVDSNGKWPTDIHNQILANAFPGLSPKELDVLKAASYNTDFKIQYNGKDPQNPSNSFIHMMRDGTTGQSVEEARALTNEFICGNEGAAMSEQMTYEEGGGKGLSTKALSSIGNALHPIMDSFSPSHAGFQPWSGAGFLWIAGIGHGAAENSITPAQLQAATKAVQGEFQNVFGDAELKRATQPPPQRRKRGFWAKMLGLDNSTQNDEN